MLGCAHLQGSKGCDHGIPYRLSHDNIGGSLELLYQDWILVNVELLGKEPHCGKGCCPEINFATTNHNWAVIWGGAKRMGEENVPENALSRKVLDPSKRASGLL